MFFNFLQQLMIFIIIAFVIHYIYYYFTGGGYGLLNLSTSSIGVDKTQKYKEILDEINQLLKQPKQSVTAPPAPPVQTTDSSLDELVSFMFECENSLPTGSVVDGLVRA
jgi:hypothetical protein